MTTILEVRALAKRFGAVTAAAGYSLAIAQDAIVGLIGTNGAGITTVVNIVTGYLAPDSGAVLYGGRDITAFAPREVTRLGICRSFQIPQLYNSLTTLENLLVSFGIVRRNARAHGLAPLPRDVPGHGMPAEAAADATLARFGLSDYRNRLAGVLPEGVRKLLDIAMALAAKPKILLLDEPTSGVSADEKFGIMDMVMQALRAEQIAVLFVEHDMEIVARYAGRVIAFYEGGILCDGSPSDVLRDPQVRRIIAGEPLPAGVSPDA